MKFQERLREILEEYQIEKRRTLLTPEIMRKMKEKGRDLPRFRIMTREKGQEFIEENRIGMNGRKLHPESALMVFNLPPILSRFWYRGGDDSWGNGSKPVKENEIEWGHFYREVMPVIWQAVGYEMAEGMLDFSRVNFINQHDPKKYYYAWEVKKASGIKKEI